ncbi:TetR/AcrR family transcriptional regulator [Amycolatopsis endophytica]|uniref:AcrR family transcriptional regulator n=1 Tax=Amycolatopsis endophytica TaxID=860233 RepID=A0A853B2S0_9PSEU|nr:TetR/AcrR family transcriptional regulator [Amycolatopsis endophytica]NYI88936.1 AcrR family transcriptional regulator [Amycolatopsis endophytica]
MPRQVDHEARKTAIARALWRVAEARGLDRVSLREVATEAGISLGQLQHYFANRDEMMIFAMEFMGRKNVERVAARMMTLAEPTPRARLRAIAHEMVPIDDRAEAGSLMQLSFLLESARNESLRDFATRQAAGLRNTLEGIVALAIRSGDLSADCDPAEEAALLIALAQGLRSDFHLGALTAEQTVALMDRYLDRLLIQVN